MQEEEFRIAEAWPEDRVEELLSAMAECPEGAMNSDEWAQYAREGKLTTIMPYIQRYLVHRQDLNEFNPQQQDERSWKEYAIAILHKQAPKIQDLIFTGFIQAGYPIPLAYHVSNEQELHINDNALDFVREHSNKQLLVLVSRIENIDPILTEIISISKIVIPTCKSSAYNYADLYIPWETNDVNYGKAILLVEFTDEDRSGWLHWVNWLKEHKEVYSSVVVIVDSRTSRDDQQYKDLQAQGLNPSRFDIGNPRTPHLPYRFESKGEITKLTKSQVRQFFTEMKAAPSPIESENKKMETQLNGYLEQETFAHLFQRTQIERGKRFEQTRKRLQTLLGRKPDVLRLLLFQYYLLHGPNSDKNASKFESLLKEVLYMGTLAISWRQDRKWCVELVSKLLAFGYPVPFLPSDYITDFMPFMQEVFKLTQQRYVKKSPIAMITIYGASNHSKKLRPLNSIFGTKYTTTNIQVWAASASLIQYRNRPKWLIINIECPGDHSRQGPEDIIPFQSCSVLSDIFVFHLMMEVLSSQVDNFARNLRPIPAQCLQQREKERPLFTVMFVNHVEKFAEVQRGQISNWAKEAAYNFDQYWTISSDLHLTLPPSIENIPVAPSTMASSIEKQIQEQLFEIVANSKGTLQEKFDEYANMCLELYRVKPQDSQFSPTPIPHSSREESVAPPESEEQKSLKDETRPDPHPPVPPNKPKRPSPSRESKKQRTGKESSTQKISPDRPTATISPSPPSKQAPHPKPQATQQHVITPQPPSPPSPKDKEIERLREENAQIRNRIADALEVKARVQEVERELGRERTDITQLVEEMKHMRRQQMTHLNIPEELRIAKEELSEQRRRVDHYEEEIANLQQTKDEYARYKLEIEHAEAAYQVQLECFNNKKGILEAAITETTNKLALKQSTIQYLQKRFDDLIHQIRTLPSISQIVSKILEEQKAQGELKRKSERLQRITRQLKQDNGNLGKNIQRLHERLISLKMKHAEAVNKSRIANASIQDLTQCKRLEAGRKIQTKVTGIRLDNERLKQEIAALEKQVEDAKEDLALLKQTNRQREQEIANLPQIEQQHLKLLRQEQAVPIATQQECEQIQNEIDVLSAHVKLLESQNQSLSQELYAFVGVDQKIKSQLTRHTQVQSLRASQQEENALNTRIRHSQSPTKCLLFQPSPSSRYIISLK